MAQAQYPYIDLSVHPEIMPHVLATHAAVVFSSDMKQVYWANGEGANLIGTPTIGLAVEGSALPNKSTMRQIGLAVEQLDDSDQASAVMRIRSGFKTRLLAFQVQPIQLTEKDDGVLLVTDALHGRGHSQQNMAEAAVGCLDGYGHSSAVFDQQGRVLAASPGFSKTELAQSDLKLLVDEVSTEDDRLIKRIIDTGCGPMAMGLARMGDDQPLHLMILAEPEKADVKRRASKPRKTSDAKAKSKAPKEKTADKEVPQAPAVGAFSSKRIKAGESGPGKWYYKNTAKSEEPNPAPVDEAESKSTQARATAKKASAKVVKKAKAAAPEKQAPKATKTRKTAVASTKPAAGKSVKKPEAAKAPAKPAKKAGKQEQQATSKPVASRRPVAAKKTVAESKPTRGKSTKVPEAPKAATKPVKRASKQETQPTPPTAARSKTKVPKVTVVKHSSQPRPESNKPTVDAQEQITSKGGLVQTISHTPIKEKPPASQTKTPASQHSETPSVGKGKQSNDGGDGFRFTAGANPVRFVWEMDADLVFTSVSGELAQTVGPQAARLQGHDWNQVGQHYAIEEQQDIAEALARQNTWSGKTVLWPIEGTDMRVPIDLAGLPSYGRNREFAGFNGFGIIRRSDTVVDPNAKGLNLDLGDLPARLAVPATQTDEEPTEQVQPSPEKETEPETVKNGKALSTDERDAFDEIAEKLGDGKPMAVPSDGAKEGSDPKVEELIPEQLQQPARPLVPSAFVPRKVRIPEHDVDTSILARLPIPVLVYRAQDLLFGNKEFFDLTGYNDLQGLADVGGVDALFGAHVTNSLDDNTSIFHSDGGKLDVFPNLQRVPWDEDRAMLLTLRRQGPDDDQPEDTPPAPDPETTGKPGPDNVASTRQMQNSPASDIASNERPKSITGNVTPLRPSQENIPRQTGDEVPGKQESRPAKAQVPGNGNAFAHLKLEDLRSILDTASDGVIILDNTGHVSALNRSAEALFDTDAQSAKGKLLVDFLAPESHRTVLNYLTSLNTKGIAGLINDGREVIGKTARGGLIPLFITMGKLESDDSNCVVLKDMTQWKKADEEMLAARQKAEDASVQKSEFLAKVSHEIRTPLNAIIGFSDIMIEERFGKLENDRYRGYVRDIQRSGGHVLDLINDLLDISKIEAGEIDLEFGSCEINTIIAETVALSQPQANKERIIIRTSLSANVPAIVADQRSLRQIILNLVTNGIKFTRPGGQVIVSTVYDENGDVVLRVRDTGIGMSKADLAKALKPFAQVTSPTIDAPQGTGLGLPLTKAMVEANRARFHIESEPEEGTLIEIFFPSQRVLADR